MTAFALFAVVWVCAMEFNSLYKHDVFINRSQQSVLLAKSCFAALMMAVFYDYLIRPENWFGSRAINAVVFPAGFLLMSIWRMVIFRTVWKNAIGSGRFIRRAAIIGATTKGERIAKRMMLKPDSDMHIVGFIDDSDTENLTLIHESNSYRILGRKHELKRIVHEHGIDQLVIAGDEFEPQEILELAETGTQLGAMVDVASDSFHLNGTPLRNGTVVPHFEFPVVHLKGNRYSVSARLLKRALDILLAGVGCILLMPVFAALAIAVRISSPGAVVYTSRRVGKGGRVFSFYKFRSMKIASEKHDPTVMKKQYEDYIKNNAVVGKILNDNRVTRIGKFMRKTSLDELPQLWNVLKGDMSIVGPRPCLPHEYEMYSEWQKKRLSVTPGCTGLWQVSDRKNISFNDMVVLDYYYIENMSLWFDIQIILKTIPVMIFGRGDM